MDIWIKSLKNGMKTSDMEVTFGLFAIAKLILFNDQTDIMVIGIMLDPKICKNNLLIYPFSAAPTRVASMTAGRQSGTQPTGEQGS